MLTIFEGLYSIKKFLKIQILVRFPRRPPPPSSCLKCEILWCSFWFVPDMRMVLTSYCFCAFLPPLLGLCNGELSLWHLFFFSTIILFFFSSLLIFFLTLINIVYEACSCFQRLLILACLISSNLTCVLWFIMHFRFGIKLSLFFDFLFVELYRKKSWQNFEEKKMLLLIKTNCAVEFRSLQKVKFSYIYKVI